MGQTWAAHSPTAANSKATTSKGRLAMLLRVSGTKIRGGTERERECVCVYVCDRERVGGVAKQKLFNDCKMQVEDQKRKKCKRGNSGKKKATQKKRKIGRKQPRFFLPTHTHTHTHTHSLSLSLSFSPHLVIGLFDLLTSL